MAAKRYDAPLVKKAFAILKIVAVSKDGIGISEISRHLKIVKSTVHGITLALEEMGVVERDSATKRYTLGPTLFELASLAHSQTSDLKELARPVMEELMEAVQETVFLGVESGDHVTVIDLVESRNTLRITAQIGATHSAFAGAVGKVFLAGLEETEAKKIIAEKKLPRFTSNSIVDPKEYIEELKQVREKGYATDDEEYLLGVQAVASLIKASKTPAAVWVAGFRILPNDDRVGDLLEGTKKAAEQISARIIEHESKGLIRE